MTEEEEFYLNQGIKIGEWIYHNWLDHRGRGIQILDNEPFTNEDAEGCYRKAAVRSKVFFSTKWKALTIEGIKKGVMQAYGEAKEKESKKPKLRLV